MQKITRYVLILLWLLIPGIVTAQGDASQFHKLSDGVRERTYQVYRPLSLSRQVPVPLVIMLHGGFGTGKQAESSYNWDSQAGQHGFVVVYPNGINHSWNAGGICCGPALRENVDDVGFLNRLIEEVSRTEDIDPKRVYLTGISNGAAMAYRFACEGAYPVAAIGPVAGSFSFSCPRPHHVSVMAIHGLEDRHIPFAGGQGAKGVTKGAWRSVQESIGLFRVGNSCQERSIQKEGLVQTEVSNCLQGREVVLITIDGAGHQWPGGKQKTGIVRRILGADPPSAAIDATSALWNFFNKHPAQP